MLPPVRSTGNSGVFRQFMRALRDDWRLHLPTITPVSDQSGWSPKSHVFYAGVCSGCALHAFLRFQYSSKSWKIGEFTLNAVFVRSVCPPEVLIPQTLPLGERLREEGTYRIGSILYHRDKWWHLIPKEVEESKFSINWFAADYDDLSKVISEAVADVTHDVRSLIARVQISSGSPPNQ